MNASAQHAPRIEPLAKRGASGRLGFGFRMPLSTMGVQSLTCNVRRGEGAGNVRLVVNHGSAVPYLQQHEPAAGAAGVDLSTMGVQSLTCTMGAPSKPDVRARLSTMGVQSLTCNSSTSTMAPRRASLSTMGVQSLTCNHRRVRRIAVGRRLSTMGVQSLICNDSEMMEVRFMITEIRFVTKINLPGTSGAVGRVDSIQAKAGYTIDADPQMTGWVRVTHNADHNSRAYPPTVIQSVALAIPAPAAAKR